jgi:hypothetical protein
MPGDWPPGEFTARASVRTLGASVETFAGTVPSVAIFTGILGLIV